MASIFVVPFLSAVILSACQRPENLPAADAGQDTGRQISAVLTAPKDGLSVNVNSVSGITFWWQPADGADSYELVVERAGDDFSSLEASFGIADKTEITLSRDALEELYRKFSNDGTAALEWTVNSVADGNTYRGRDVRRLFLTNAVEPCVVEALFSPEDGHRADLVLIGDALSFSWSAAESHVSGRPSYTLVLDRKGGDFTSPVASFDAGEATSINIPKGTLRELFDANAPAGAKTLPLVWTVSSRSGDGVWYSEAIHNLTISDLPVAYSNPVFTGFSLPDPDVIRADDGYFYLYATEHNRNDVNMKNSPIMRSKDLIDWTRVGALFTDQTHPQITDQNPAGIWAPSVNKVAGRYVVYYSQPGRNYKHAIGVAVSDSPAGPFTDLGKIIDSNEQGVDISIDAYLYQEDGRNYLFWGSFRSISVLELTADGTAIKNKDTQKRREVAGGQYEASVVLKRDGWYYLIVSTGDYSKGGTYRLVAGRSRSIFGPYTDKNGNDMMSVHHELVLKGNNEFTSPGHCSRIITDDAGQVWLLYNAYTEDMDYRCLMLDRVDWVDGWPVSPGQQPSSKSVDRPIFR